MSPSPKERKENGREFSILSRSCDLAKDPIIFRILKVEDAEALKERAAEARRTIHATARDLVTKSLHQVEDEQEVIEKVDKLARQVFELREEISLVAEVLLANAGKASPEQASNRVDSNLKAK